MIKLIIVILILLMINPAYGLEVSSSSFLIDIFTFLNGGGPASSTNHSLEFSAIGEGMVSLEESLSTNFRLLAGQLYLILPPLPWERIKVISDLMARQELLGPFIFQATWQKDNDPYFYWQIKTEPESLLTGFSVSLDVSPDELIDTTLANYQFPEDIITSGKHLFYVLPFTTGDIADRDSLLQFELWVDTDPPLINQMTPYAGEITNNALTPISCFINDEHSGLDLNLTTLSLNNRRIYFDYDPKTQLLKFIPQDPLPEGKNTLLLKAFDAAGNYVVKGWEFMLDTQAPTGSILINAGAEVTHSAFCFINIEAQDTTSGIKNIYISNDGIFDTELEHPYAYSPLISNWLLSQPDVNGIKTVYVRFQDFAGNLSLTYKDEIILELRTPDTRIISGPTSVTQSNEATLIYEASKTGCLFSYKLDNLDWSAWLSADTSHFSGLAQGNHYFYVKSGFDLNGDGTITIDEEDATPAQWVWTVKPVGFLERLRGRILFWKR